MMYCDNIGRDYNEVVDWQRAVFALPEGTPGKDDALKTINSAVTAILASYHSACLCNEQSTLDCVMSRARWRACLMLYKRKNTLRNKLIVRCLVDPHNKRHRLTRNYFNRGSVVYKAFLGK